MINWLKKVWPLLNFINHFNSIVDENYFTLLSKPEDFEQIFKQEDEEDKNDVTLEEFDLNKKPQNNSVAEINAESSENEEEIENFDQLEKVKFKSFRN